MNAIKFKRTHFFVPFSILWSLSSPLRQSINICKGLQGWRNWHFSGEVICESMVPSVKFLREYHVNAEGRQPRDEEIGGINGAETRFYLGLINRYGNFMPNPSKKLLRIGVKWASTETF